MTAPPPGVSQASADARAHRPVFLFETRGRTEQRVLERWIAENHRDTTGPVETVDIAGDRGRSRLEARIAQGDNPLFAPLRVTWFPKQRADGSRRVGFVSLLFGDPREPGPLRQRWVAHRAPDRVEVVAGEPATLDELRHRWRDAGGLDVEAESSLAEFVGRQARLALERAERRIRGNRYKVPRLLREDILSRPAFRGAVSRLAATLGRSEGRVLRDANRYLREIAAAHNPTMIDLTYQLFRFMSTRSYRKLSYDRDALEAIAAESQRHPIVFLPSHKSNLDHPSLYTMLFENGLPPTHTAGGINMNFFPVGPVVRRSGVFFIRRSFKDNEVYKLVLHHYVDYLISKRFSLEWYIEGGRSRSGKLLPPRFGLLAYVVDAYRRGKSEDVILVPTSIAYDQIQDVGDYVAEERGATKQRESFRWLLGLLRKLRRLGEIEVRFGEPVSLAKMLGPPTPGAPPDPDETNLSLQKVAFEVCMRINRATPLTPTSMVTLALLGVGDRALSVDQVSAALEDLLAYAERRQLPGNGVVGLAQREGVKATLRELERSGVVTAFEEGRDPVYRIGDNQHLAAAYYRNTVIHFFLSTSIAELALLGAAEVDAGGRREAFLRESLAIRDLLKFEFFFPERDRFSLEMQRELAHHDAHWENALRGSPEDVRALARRLRPLAAHFVLRPFLEGYWILADALHHAADQSEASDALVERCLALGRQYTLQRRIRSAESVSKSTFQTGLKLAAGRGLLEASPGLAERRAAFARELGEVVRRVDAIEAFAAAQHLGVAV